MTYLCSIMLRLYGTEKIQNTEKIFLDNWVSKYIWISLHIRYDENGQMCETDFTGNREFLMFSVERLKSVISVF